MPADLLASAELSREALFPDRARDARTLLQSESIERQPSVTDHGNYGRSQPEQSDECGKCSHDVGSVWLLGSYR